MSRSIIVCVVAVVAMMSGCAASRGLERFEYTRLCMGVKTRIVLYSDDESHAMKAAAAAFDRIGELDAVMSDYRHDSEVNRLGERAGTGPIGVSSDLLEVLNQSLAVSRASDGAFDVTVGPLVALWRNARQSQSAPDSKQRENARRLVSWQHMTVDGRLRTVSLHRANMRLDLGGIGKGYAAQQAVELLKSRGMSHCLVALAGDIVVGDPPPGATGWNVAIGSSPDLPMLSLANSAISTSGDTEQFIDINGVRHSHIIDPRTGMGVTNRLVVTVLARRGELADALASAACVLGQDHLDRFIGSFPEAAAIVMPAHAPANDAMMVIDPSKRVQWADCPEGNPP